VATVTPVPPLAEFLRWMTEMPDAFRGEPREATGGVVAVRAVVADLFETISKQRPEEALLIAFQPASMSKLERNRLRWVLAACHLLWHPSLRARGLDPAPLRKLLVQELSGLAAVVPADALVNEEERREELIRRTLNALGLLLPGETQEEAEDRLTQVDAVERQRLIREATEKEKRAREIREEMARKTAAEAAAKVSRE
jgi:hypothetical protein